MSFPKIFSNRHYRWMIVIVAIFILAFVTINIFVIGGDLFIFTFNSALNLPLALLIAVFSAALWRLMSKEKYNRTLWSGMVVGWALWAIAETIWTIYSFFGQEVPYPSPADFFWIFGYIPMGIGLIARVRTMPANPSQSQNIVISGASVITILVTVNFILRPILQDFEPQRLVESILNLLYPLADLFLVVIVWRLFFTYEEGEYGFCWRILNLGFIFMIASDLIFTHATWQEIYYPDMKANLISRFGVDVPYTLSYLMWFVGIYTLRVLLKEKRPNILIGRIRVVRKYGHILVYTKDDDTVISVSPNFERFFENGNVKGKPLAKALTISDEEAHAILGKLREEGHIGNIPLQIQDYSGSLREVSLSGLMVGNPQKAYLGGNFVLRTRTADASFDGTLNKEQRAMALYLLEKSGSNPKSEIAQFLSDYYLTYIKSLLDMAFYQGGENLTQALLDRLEETAHKNGWQIQFNSEAVLDHAQYSLEVLRDALPVLLDTARQFVSDVTGPDVVEAHIQEVSSQISESIHSDVTFYEKSKGTW